MSVLQYCKNSKLLVNEHRNSEVDPLRSDDCAFVGGPQVCSGAGPWSNKSWEGMESTIGLLVVPFDVFRSSFLSSRRI